MKRFSVYVLAVLLGLPCVASAQPVVFIDSPAEKISGLFTGYGYACEENGQGIQPLFGSFNGGPKTQISSLLPRADAASLCNGNSLIGFSFVANSAFFPDGENIFELWGPSEDRLLTSSRFSNTRIPGVEFLVADQATNGIAIWQNFPANDFASALAFAQNVQGPLAGAIRSTASPGPTAQEVQQLVGTFNLTLTNFDGTTRTLTYDTFYDANSNVVIEDLGNVRRFVAGDIYTLFPDLRENGYVNPFLYGGADTQECLVYLFNLTPDSSPGSVVINGTFFPNSPTDQGCNFFFTPLQLTNPLEGTLLQAGQLRAQTAASIPAFTGLSFKWSQGD